MRNPFRYFNSSPEVIRLTVMMYLRYPLSLRQVEDLLFERGIDICHETVRFWWNRFGPMFANEIRKRRLHHRSFSHWRWHLDDVRRCQLKVTVLRQLRQGKCPQVRHHLRTARVRCDRRRSASWLQSSGAVV